MAKIVGKDIDGADIYEKTFKGSTLTDGQILDSNIKNIKWFTYEGSAVMSNQQLKMPMYYKEDNNMQRLCLLDITTGGLHAIVRNYTVTDYYVTVRYVKIS